MVGLVERDREKEQESTSKQSLLTFSQDNFNPLKQNVVYIKVCMHFLLSPFVIKYEFLK